MKLKYDMDITDVGGELMGVPKNSGDEFSGVIRMNDTTADIIKHMQEETSEEKIVEKLKTEYDAPEGELKEGVSSVVKKLRNEGLLSE